MDGGVGKTRTLTWKWKDDKQDTILFQLMSEHNNTQNKWKTNLTNLQIFLFCFFSFFTRLMMLVHNAAAQRVEKASERKGNKQTTELHTRVSGTRCWTRLEGDRLYKYIRRRWRSQETQPGTWPTPFINPLQSASKCIQRVVIRIGGRERRGAALHRRATTRRVQLDRSCRFNALTSKNANSGLFRTPGHYAVKPYKGPIREDRVGLAP